MSAPDLRERILAWIDAKASDCAQMSNGTREFRNDCFLTLWTLRGEVERHEPDFACCQIDRPCPTLQRIAKGLGIEEE